MYPRHQAYFFDNGRGSETEARLAGYVEYPFNGLIGWTAEMGLVGLALLSCLIVFVIRRWYRQKRSGIFHPMTSLAASVMVAWGIFSLFSYPLDVPVLAIFGILAYSSLTTTLSGLPGNTFLNKKISTYVLMYIFMSGSMSIYSLFWVNRYRPFIQSWIIANNHYQLGEYKFANGIYLYLGRFGLAGSMWQEKWFRTKKQT